MAEFIRAALSQIHIGERLRPIDPGYVEAIAASMSEIGQISPIMLRRTPNQNKGKTPYTLVAGGYRTSAAIALGWTEIDAIIVAADTVETQLLEISENLFRNELNAIDRVTFVMKYRELWEEKHGKITPGGDQKSKVHDAHLIFHSGRELAQTIQERLGIGPDTYKRAVRIYRNMTPELRVAVRGTDAEDDQSLLLKLSKMPREDQVKAAATLRVYPDVRGLFSALRPQRQYLAKTTTLKELKLAWERASDEVRAQFLSFIDEPIEEAA